MAIKERKQITGTEAQIKGYAGHNGVLAYATDTKHLHVLSGTAGTATELANRTDIPDVTGKADKTYVDTELTKKQPKGDYATNTALTQGLAGKANSSHTHTVANVTGLQDALNTASTKASNAIPKAGDRGAIAGYEQWTIVGATTTLNVSSGDSLLMQPAGAAATITVQAGSVGQVATKLVWVYNSNKSITINGPVGWFAGDVPTLNKTTAVLLFFFHDTYSECRLIGQWDEP
nr:MAG TPA: tail repeat-like protein [Caudoviricetes sp.]